jgi:squalene-hopene/tetraprenyl-beta-curcumene cyclase
VWRRRWNQAGPPAAEPALQVRIQAAVGRGFSYLAREQRADGSWAPLWFGNQHHPQEENPLYGTARVLLAYRDFDRLDSPQSRRALAYLADRQNRDGGWGGAACGGRPGSSTVEETALVVESLWAGRSVASLQTACMNGLGWLVQAVEEGRHAESSPIGFYFAKLWYYEALYPLIFTASALGQAVAGLQAGVDLQPTSTREPTNA